MSLSSVRLTVDLDALAANLAVLRDAAGGAECAPVVKADGYGLGVGPVVRRLWREGVRSFFVARVAEGEAVRAALGPGRPATVYVLDGLTPGAGPRLAAAGLTPALMSWAQVEAAVALGGAGGAPLPVALHVDTGMNRQGLTPGEALALAADRARLSRLEVGLVMSHLGSAAQPDDPRNRAQLERFREVRRRFPQSRASLAASAGIFLGPDYRFEMVRPGVSLYGGGPQERPDARFAAVARLEAPLLEGREAAAGEAIGYGLAVRAPRTLRLGIVAAGYADGIIRAAKGAGYAWAAGARRPLVIVTMNMIAIDLGDAVMAPGEPVELLGPNALLDDQASAAGSVAHECLTRLSTVAERRYLGGD
ncbi:alanine racemase [Phenylobacterium sp.]|jgi:alanine racemase|uniref:alanine racemase n=1 Tax=Phenylobacterium sp. TaxID=1871053 RepID=UPI002F3FCCB5